ncbi:MAG TPA: hypothetical protein VJ696_07700 [Rhodanobacteraceae bacterium]|nr:hypothetical protein [Rhodanobacteraceae bacterium]
MLKTVYVATMRAIAAPLRRLGVLERWQHAPRDSFRFWLGSQFAIHDAAELARMDVPWWTLPAIDAVEKWIAAREGKVRVFEYGSGASTVWLARRCEHVVSVEHDARFARIIGPMLPSNAELRVIAPELAVSTPQAGSGRRGYEDCDFAAYVDAIAAGDTRYDLVIIDGRARAACLARAPKYLNTGGMIVFDNSKRRRYRAAFAAFPGRAMRHRGWAPALPYRSETTLLELGRS